MSKGTTIRNVRVSDELWDAALRCAKQENLTVSDVIRDSLQEWVTRHADKTTTPQTA